LAGVLGSILLPNGIGFLSITAKNWKRRAADVNPPISAHHRAAIAATGTHQGGTGRCFAGFYLTSWKVGWAVAITERLTPVSNHRKRVDSSGEEKVFILRANFFEGLLLEHVQLRSQWGPLSRRRGAPRHP
jgi:hypothetical protein